MTSAQVVGASFTHNSLPEDYSHVEGHNNQILLRCWWWHLSAGVRGADGIGDWNCHISLSESHTVHWDEHGHGLRARRRQPGWRRADQRRADGRVWRRRKRREARDLVRWHWTYRCGGSQMRDITGRVRIQVRGVTVVLFDDFVIVRSKTGSKRRDVPIGEREPLMENSQLSTATWQQLAWVGWGGQAVENVTGVGRKFDPTRVNSSEVAWWSNDTQLHRSREPGLSWEYRLARALTLVQTKGRALSFREVLRPSPSLPICSVVLQTGAHRW